MLASRDRPALLPDSAAIKLRSARHGGRIRLAVRRACMVGMAVWSSCQHCAEATLLCACCESYMRYCAMSEEWVTFSSTLRARL